MKCSTMERHQEKPAPKAGKYEYAQNDLAGCLHAGAMHICMQAVLKRRSSARVPAVIEFCILPTGMKGPEEKVYPTDLVDTMQHVFLPVSSFHV